MAVATHPPTLWNTQTFTQPKRMTNSLSHQIKQQKQPTVLKLMWNAPATAKPNGQPSNNEGTPTTALTNLSTATTPATNPHQQILFHPSTLHQHRCTLRMHKGLGPRGH